MDAMTLLPLALALVAFLYALVGHGGASGYLAVLALAGAALGEVRASALMLNILVSGIATVQFARKGHFRHELLWPFAMASIPAAWLGGTIVLDPSIYLRILAVCLLAAAIRLLGVIGERAERRRPSWLLALAIGAGIGLVSGLIGIGGGILLSPLLLLLGWASAREAAAVSAPFIMLNSLAGLLGVAGGSAAWAWPPWPWLAAAAVGGLMGSGVGAAWIGERWMRRALALVLIFASVKLGLA